MIDILYGSGEMSFEEVVDAVAAREAVGDDVPTSDERNRIWTALYQSHTPRLASDGAVAYNPALKTLELTEEGERLYRAYCEFADELSQ